MNDIRCIASPRNDAIAKLSTNIRTIGRCLTQGTTQTHTYASTPDRRLVRRIDFGKRDVSIYAAVDWATLSSTEYVIFGR